MERKKSKKIAASKNSPLKTSTNNDNDVMSDNDERLYFSWENYLFFIYGKILLEG